MSVAALNVNLQFACRFDETSGTSIFDWKNCNTGTLTGATLNQTGPGTNKAILFNGSSNFIEFLGSLLGTDLDVSTNPYSVEVWFKTTNLATQTILQKAVTTGGARTECVTLDGGGGSSVVRAGFSNGSTSSLPTSNPSQNDGTWRQIVMVRDTNSPYRTRVYINGSQDVLDATNPSTPDNIGSLLFGKNAGSTEFWNGYIALPRWWVNRILSPSDVSELWNGGAGLDIYIAPVLSLRSVVPPSAPNTGPVNITNLVGRLLNVGTSPVVKLKKTGQPDVNCTAVTQVSSKKVTCTADITNIATGLWDVYYEDSSGNTTLANGFTVTVPSLTSCTPAGGPNTGSFNITNLAGTNFFGTSPVVKFQKLGQSDIVATAVSQSSSTQVTCTVDLTNVASGLWNIYYQDSTGNATLANGFTVTPVGTKITCTFDITNATIGLWDVYYTDDNGNDTLAASFEVLQSSPEPSPLPGVSPSIPSDSIKHVLNSARFKGSTVLDTTNETGKERLNDISTLRDTILSVMKATSKANVHVNTSAGKKLKAIASLNPATATAADIVNAVRNN